MIIQCIQLDELRAEEGFQGEGKRTEGGGEAGGRGDHLDAGQEHIVDVVEVPAQAEHLGGENRTRVNIFVNSSI